MAWTCTGRTNAELVQNLFREGLIKSERVRDAMLGVDRAHYAPTAPYTDSPQPIGHSATISAPHMHATAATHLLPFCHPSARILDIGSGSGYLTHVLANLVAQSPNPQSSSSQSSSQTSLQGKVVGIEHIQALVDLGRLNMSKSEEGRSYLESGFVGFVKGDGRKGFAGAASEAASAAAIPSNPLSDCSKEIWDAIHVGAAAAEIHQELVDQLKRPGRLFTPVEERGLRGVQYVWVVDKDEKGEVRKERLFGVRYVPLCDAPDDDIVF